MTFSCPTFRIDWIVHKDSFNGYERKSIKCIQLFLPPSIYISFFLKKFFSIKLHFMELKTKVSKCNLLFGESAWNHCIAPRRTNRTTGQHWTSFYVRWFHLEKFVAKNGRRERAWPRQLVPNVAMLSLFLDGPFGFHSSFGKHFHRKRKMLPGHLSLSVARNKQ